MGDRERSYRDFVPNRYRDFVPPPMLVPVPGTILIDREGPTLVVDDDGRTRPLRRIQSRAAIPAQSQGDRPMPYYPVTPKGADKPRVVKAANPAAALRHVAADTITIGEPLNNDQLVAAIEGGTKVERAGEAEQAEGETSQGLASE